MHRHCAATWMCTNMYTFSGEKGLFATYLSCLGHICVCAGLRLFTVNVQGLHVLISSYTGDSLALLLRSKSNINMQEAFCPLCELMPPQSCHCYRNAWWLHATLRNQWCLLLSLCCGSLRQDKFAEAPLSCAWDMQYSW